MEPARAGSLTAQEKAQLKEKLAALKREYVRTVHRLQRAERAEKVKNYVRKTVAEQNLLLLQGKSGKDEAEPLSQAAHEGSSVEVLACLCSPAVPTKTASVSFKPQPEVFSPGACLAQSPGFEHTSRDCEKSCMSPEGSVPARRTPRVHWRANVALEEGGASPGSLRLQEDVDSELEPTSATAGRSRSPVFKSRSSSKILEMETACSLSRTRGGWDGIGVAALEPKSSQETIFPGLLHPLACGSSQMRLGSSLDHRCEAGILASGEGAVAESAVPQAGSRHQEKAPASVEKAQQGGQVAEEDLGSWTDSVASKAPTPQPPLDEERSCQAPENPGSCKDTSSVSGPNTEDLADHLEDGTPLPEGNPSATSPKNVLSSCTVIEGLLFPIEYYVRTTRRMSCCPRELNVEAVLQSQLGKSRRGQRVSHKEKAGSTILLLSQEAAAAAAAKGDPGPDSAANGTTASPSHLVSPSLLSGPVFSVSPAESKEVLPFRRSERPSRRASSCTSRDLPEAALPEGADCLPSGRKGACRREGKAAACPVGPRGRRGLAPKRPGSPETESAAQLSASSLSGNSTLCLFDSQPPEQHLSQAGPKLDKTVAPPDESPEASLEGGRGRLPKGTPGAVSPCLFGAGLVHRKEGPLFQWLPPSLGLQEFCLPEEEFGLLKREKCQACSEKPREARDAGESPEGLLCAVPEPEAAVAEDVTGGPVPARNEEPSASLLGRPCVPGKGFTSSELLLSPAFEGGSCPQESQLLTLAFPLVGATPASPVLPPGQILPEALSASPLQETPDRAHEPGPFGQASSLPESGTRTLWPPTQGRASRAREEEALNLEQQQSPVAESPKYNKDTTKQPPHKSSLCPVSSASSALQATVSGSAVRSCPRPPCTQGVVAGEPSEALAAGQSEGCLQMTSNLKNSSGSFLVDVSTLWWEVAGSTELCLVTATETTVTLWRRADLPAHWEATCTWHVAKVLVNRLVPLPGVCSRLCVALGGQEVKELRFLFPSLEAGGFEQSLVKAGDIKAVLGLQHRRLVTGCGSLHEQKVEVLSFSEAGRSHEARLLMAPEETLMAFAEVDGMEEALVGMAAVNCVVVWNLISGQLLRRIVVGDFHPASLCHRAYSDSGLLFVVFSHPQSNESESRGSPAFHVVALNPKTARSLEAVALSLPPGTEGRYLEGEVRGASAAAVLTSGAIAIWDLCRGRCTALLPPSSEGRWTRVRWSVTEACLLAGRENGSVCIYSYTAGLHSA